jgi:hypothetical protein
MGCANPAKGRWTVRTCKAPDDPEALIDIQFRNGTVRRGTQGKKWRWGASKVAEYDWDIVKWQEAKGTAA